VKPLLPLRPPFLARLDAAGDLVVRLLRGVGAPGAPGAPPEEFDGHRPYFPGDDVRWVDWNLYARQEELAVKVYRADEEPEVLLLVDASPSMTAGDGRKLAYAAAAAAALARLALRTGHPVRVGRYAGRLLDQGGPWRGAPGYAAAERLLARPAGGEGTDLGAGAAALLGTRPRPATMVAITDGFQGSALGGAASGALARGARRFILLRILDPVDLAPPLRGRLAVLDPEGRDSVEIVGDRAFEAAAHRAIAEHFAGLAARLARLGAPVLELPVDRPFEEAFLGVLRTGVRAA